MLNIKSIHSYDSLSSKHYQRLVLQLSKTGTTTYGRYFNRIDSDAKLDQAAFSYTGVKLILSRQKLHNNLFEDIDEINGVTFYRTLTPPILEAQLIHFAQKEDKQIIVTGYLNEQTTLAIEKLITMDNFMRFKVTPTTRETLLFISQQYHPHWRASTKGTSLVTVMINDFYLGTIIPPHVDVVDLEFKPFVRWSWIPQVMYIVVGFGLLVEWLRRKGIFHF